MAPLRRVKLTQLNAHLVCVLCSGYFVDATTIIECLHTFCKTCIVRYLQTSSFCPICDVQVHKTKPLLSLREDRTLQDVVFKLVPGLFHSEMKRRFYFYKEHPEGGGDKTEQSLRERRHFFHVDDQISLSLEHLPAPPCLTHPLVHPHVVKPLKAINGQPEKQQKPAGLEEKDETVAVKDEVKKEIKEDDVEEQEVNGAKVAHKRYLRCPAAVQVSHLEKFVRLKYNLAPQTHRVEIMHGGDCLMGELTLLDVVYMYKWTEDAPLRLLYTVSVVPQSRKRARPSGPRVTASLDVEAPSSKMARLQAPPPSPQDKSTSPPVSVSKGQEIIKDIGKVAVVATTSSSEVKMEEAGQTTALQAHAASVTVPDRVCVTASVVSITTPSETLVAARVTNTNIINCSSSGVPPSVTPSGRGRPAVTNTTPATSTPRVALGHMPPPPAPVPVSTPQPTVSLAAVGPSTSTTVAPTFTTKPHTNMAIASATTEKSQSPQPLVNGLADCGVKPVRSPGPGSVLGPGPYSNKMPQPIIPTRPRLGRPPNSSRINAAKMRPPAPRITVPGADVRPRAMGKMYPGGVTARPNPVVSASLSVQSRLSSISGPPVKLAASKVSVKRSTEGVQEDCSPPSLHPTSSPSITTTITSTTSTTTTSSAPSLTTQGPDTGQLLSPPQHIPSSKLAASVQPTAPVSKGASMSVAHQGQVPLSGDRSHQKQSGPQSQGSLGVQRPGKQALQRPAAGGGVRPATQAQPHLAVPQGPRHPGPQVSQRPSPPNSNYQAPTPSTHQRPSLQLNQRLPIQGYPQTQGTQQPSSPQVTQHSGPQSVASSPQHHPAPGFSAGHGMQKQLVSSGNQRLSSSGMQRPLTASGPQRSATPTSTRPPGSPAPHRPPGSPAPHRAPSSPASHRAPSSPAPHRAPSSPAPHRAPSSPAPHRQPGSMTPRPHSTPTPPSTTPSPRSTPSPRCVSSPSTSTTTGMKDPLPPPQSINSTASSTTQSTGTVTVSNGNSAGPKLPEANSQSRSVLPLSNASTQNPPTKTVSPGGGKAAPKSPGRGRGASSSPTILSIAQSLANRQMQQRATTAVTPANTTTTTTSTPTTTQIGGTHQAYTTVANTPVYPGTVGGGLVSPALAAAAYISAYGDAAALQDVTAMRNLITLSQTAACIRELNLAAMVKTLPRPSDPAPIDLSPTSKAAPHTPLTNGRPLTSTTSMTATKTTASKSPSKAARSSTIPNTPTISPPTPEVTITKLPNTPASAPSTNTPSSGMAKTSFGTAKLGSSNTNTVSITKRPASSKISVTKSPANASVRQIPNPSFVRHQSEARNNNNVSKASPTVSGSSHTVTNTTTAKSAARQTGGGVGRAAGNSPLKETGPLPETSSILKIEHLTRSLAAPAAAAAAAAAAHGFNFFDNR